MTKNEQKQLDRAAQHGFGGYLRALAVIHRSGSTRTQREIDVIIKGDDAFSADLSSHFVRINGALVHRSEA